MRSTRDGRWQRRWLHCIAPLVPARRRDDWLREWDAELCHVEAAGHDSGWRVIGALPHALWLRRDQWRLESIRQDLKFAWRSTGSRPAFAAIVVATLGLGIGANVAMFTIVNAVLIQPLPYPHANQLMLLNGQFSRSDEAAISPPDFLDYRAGNTVFTAMAARSGGGTAVLAGPGDPVRVRSAAVTANFFATLGVAPLAGRTFSDREESPGEAPTGILSYGLWQQEFAGDPRIVGTTVVLDGAPTTIVGIMPPVLDRTLDDELWTPLVFHTPGTSTRRFHFLRSIARLKPGVSITQARAAMDVIARQLAAVYPENESWRLRIRPYRDVVVGNVGPALVLLLGAVGLVLLIACGNVAALLLARATSRRGEVAVRTALGASRTRLMRQLLTEAMLLASGGGVAGLAIAAGLIAVVRATGSGILPRLAEVHIDPTVMLFALAVTLVTGLVFGIAPAFHAVGNGLATALHTTGRGSAVDRRGGHARDALVVTQVALSLMLLVGAGLLVRSLSRLQHVDAGFTADHVLTAELALPATIYRDSLALRRFWGDVVLRTRAIPGVVDASATTTLPLSGGNDTYYWIDGSPPTSDKDRRNALINVVAPGYFETMRIRMNAGREFNQADQGTTPHAVVINASLARSLFAGTSAIGRRLVVDFGQPFTATIVGVANDVLAFGLASRPNPTLYFDYTQVQDGTGRPTLVVRSRGDATRLAPQLRAVVAGLSRDVPLAEVRTMDDVSRSSAADLRFQSRLLAAFALMALVLAVIGVYGVLAYAVNQRTREIGVRLALGAPRHQVFAIVLRRGMSIVGAGIVLGLVASFAATQLLAALLFQVGRTDPVVYAAAILGLAGAGTAACVIPARRATRIDPQAALRME